MQKAVRLSRHPSGHMKRCPLKNPASSSSKLMTLHCAGRARRSVPSARRYVNQSLPIMRGYRYCLAGHAFTRLNAKNAPYDAVRQIKIPKNVLASKMA